MPTRHVYMVLSPRSLSYARDALESLFRNSVETLHLRLITDSPQDKEELSETMAALDSRTHRWTVYAEQDMVAREDALFAEHSNLRAFRRGHPCWRKITDPLLLSDSGEELVLLDPDLYFPNRFQFEQTPQSGLLLMWQRPNCLYPPDVVRTAIDAGFRLAHHVDIGVASRWWASRPGILEMLASFPGKTSEDETWSERPAHSQIGTLGRLEMLSRGRRS